MSMWKEEKLADHYTISSGLSKPAKDFGSGFPFLSFSDVFWNYFAPKELGQLVQSTEKEREKCSVKKGDVFLTRTSETVEELGMSCVALKDYPDATFNGFTKRLRPKTGAIDSQFIGFYLRSPQFRAELTAYSTLTTRASLNNSILNRLSIKLPPLPTQQKIARLLSRYDDLIEINLRRIGLLEELARVTYEEWFVRGRFPEMESSSNSKTSLGEITKIGSSKRIFLDDYTEVGIPFYRGKEITLKSKNEPVSSGQFISNEKFTAISEKYGSPQEGDILITAVGTIGSVYMVKKSDVPFYFKDGNVLWLRPGAKDYSVYLYMFLSSVTFLQILHNNSIGSSQKALTIKALKAIEIVMPSRKTISQFDKIAEPIFASVEMLLSQNIYLREARDLLLPRLMAGAVDLDEMEEV